MRFVNKDPRRTRHYPFFDLSFAHEGIILTKISAIFFEFHYRVIIALLKFFHVREETCLVKT